MSDKFFRTGISELLKSILKEHKQHHRILGIPDPLFFRPAGNEVFRSIRFGQELGTPLGVAAGPHSQLSRNIIAAWLCGARYIELKTIQTLDELEIRDSLDEYVNAWVLIHLLHHYLELPGKPGLIFNMSAGYNLEGILKNNVQQFFAGMLDAGKAISEKKMELSAIYPGISQINIPARISDNITLSTMHGCPPDEIEEIPHHHQT
jgi:putative selenate reductase